MKLCMVSLSAQVYTTQWTSIHRLLPLSPGCTLHTASLLPGRRSREWAGMFSLPTRFGFIAKDGLFLLVYSQLARSPAPPWSPGVHSASCPSAADCLVQQKGIYKATQRRRGTSTTCESCAQLRSTSGTGSEGPRRPCTGCDVPWGGASLLARPRLLVDAAQARPSWSLAVWT